MFKESTAYETSIIAQRMLAEEMTPVALQRYFIDTVSAYPKVVVRVETNDDDDDGYPDGAWEQWQLEFNTVAQAIKHTGVCRIGISGVIVTVEIDGKEVR